VAFLICNICEDKKKPIDDIEAHVKKMIARRIGIKMIDVTNAATKIANTISAGNPNRSWDRARPSI